MFSWKTSSVPEGWCIISEYSVVQCEYNDAECIKASLKELGYECEEHAEAQNLTGYEGSRRVQRAHIIVKRQQVGAAANDVGFRRKSNGQYELIISDFDRRQGSKTATNFLVSLKQVYAKHKVVKQLKKMGITITSVKKTADGRIKIKALA